MFLGVDERTSRRWVSGESRFQSSVPVALLCIRLKYEPRDTDWPIEKRPPQEATLQRPRYLTMLTCSPTGVLCSSMRYLWVRAVRSQPVV